MCLKRAEDNKGTTLIELIVVIAIIAIVVAVSSFGIALAYSRDSEKAAKTIDAQLGNLRMTTMSKEGEWYAVIVATDAENSIAIYKEGVAEAIEKETLPKRVKISYEGSYDDGSSVPSVSYTKIVFDKFKGVVKYVSTGAGMSEILAANTAAPALLKIKTENDSGSKHANVELIRETGKHYVTYE